MTPTQTNKAPCPLCARSSDKVIYYALPMWYCVPCQVMFGFWAYPATLLPFVGGFMVYEGSYWAALWHWLCSGGGE